MSNHYVYVYTSYECSPERFRHDKAKMKFLENLKKYVNDGSIVYGGNLMRKDKRDDVLKILEYFGGYKENCSDFTLADCWENGIKICDCESECICIDRDPVCERHCQCTNEIHCYDLECQEHGHIPYFHAYIQGTEETNDHVFPLENGYDLNYPLFQLNTGDLMDIIKIVKKM